jgi:hypothetical protein
MQDDITNPESPKVIFSISRRMKMVFGLFPPGFLLLFIFAGPLWAIIYLFIVHSLLDIIPFSPSWGRLILGGNSYQFYSATLLRLKSSLLFKLNIVFSSLFYLFFIFILIPFSSPLVNLISH